MKDAMATTPIVGEVGLDGTARTPIDVQLAALREILGLVVETPRIVSIHSHRATGLVLEELRNFRPAAAILHWWLGSPEETEAAVEIGAYFSVNASQAKRWSGLGSVPLDHLFLETDHPFGDRSELHGSRPGHLPTPEKVVSAEFSISPEALRHQAWQNLKAIAEEHRLVDMFPREFQVQFLTL
jgi:TatD DNase family protein